MFTLVDGVVAVVLLISAGMAFMRGFVHEVLAIGAWVGAGIACLYGFDYAHPWVAAQVSPAWAADLVTVAALFLISLLLLSLITKAIADRVRQSALNSVDSSLGFVFGLARGALLVSAAYYIATSWIFDPQELPQWLNGAKTRPWLEKGAVQVSRLRPQSLMNAQMSAPLSTATGNLLEDAERAAQAAAPDTASVESLTTPKLTNPSAQAPKDAKTKGYGKDERHAMDRLIHNTQ